MAETIEIEQAQNLLAEKAQEVEQTEESDVALYEITLAANKILIDYYKYNNLAWRFLPGVAWRYAEEELGVHQNNPKMSNWLSGSYNTAMLLFRSYMDVCDGVKKPCHKGEVVKRKRCRTYNVDMCGFCQIPGKHDKVEVASLAAVIAAKDLEWLNKSEEFLEAFVRAYKDYPEGPDATHPPTLPPSFPLPPYATKGERKRQKELMALENTD